MAKLKGPLFSVNAKGKLGNALIFSSARGIKKASRHFKPHNPRTALQQDNRSIMRYAVWSWQSLTDDQKWSYDQSAKNLGLKMSGYNYYLQTYIAAYAVAPPPPPPEPILDHLVSWWKLDENAGDTAYDSIGNNHLTRYGASWVPGKINSALYFDGVNNHATIEDADTIGISGDDFVAAGGFTIEFWIKPSAWSSDTCLVMKGIDHDSSEYAIWADWYGQWLAFKTHKTRFVHQRFYDTVNINTRLPVGGWYHIAFTMIPNDGSSIKVYKDGEDITSDFYWHDGDGNEGWADWDGPFRIGSNTNNTAWLNSKIDELRIYDKVLTFEEIQHNFSL